MKIMGNDERLIDRLKELMENEARSCSMDFGCITSEYVSRMWGGTVPNDEIESALNYLKTNEYDYR